MKNQFVLGVVLPAYNEAPVIVDVIKRIPKKIKGVAKIRVIVVNDGSNDATASKVGRCQGVILLNHKINLGVGAATMTGIEATRKLNCDLAVTVDADGQHDPSEIKDMVAPLVRGEADIVIGTRFLIAQDIPKTRVFFNKLANLLTGLLYGVKVSDSQSGFRAYNKKALTKLTIDVNGFEVCSELIGQAHRLGLRIKEVPISVSYTRYSKSKGQGASNALSMGLNLLFKSMRRK